VLIIISYHKGFNYVKKHRDSNIYGQSKSDKKAAGYRKRPEETVFFIPEIFGFKQ